MVASSSLAQYRLAGVVISTSDSAAIKDCTIFLDYDQRSTITDSHGRFIFDDLPNGKYIVHFTSLEHQYIKIDASISNTDEFVKITLEPREQTLEEIVISDLKSTFGFTRMGSVENFGIYEGKKSEVIIPDQLVANTATNNARQIYSRVAGLNIWENDGAGLQLSIGGRGLDPNRT